MSHGKACASLHGMAPSEPHLSKTCSAQVLQASFYRSSGLPMLEDSVLIHDKHGCGRPTAGLVAHSGIEWLRSTFKLLPWRVGPMILRNRTAAWSKASAL